MHIHVLGAGAGGGGAGAGANSAGLTAPPGVALVRFSVSPAG